MGVYCESATSQLKELLSLVRKERADFENAAKLVKESIDAERNELMSEVESHAKRKHEELEQTRQELVEAENRLSNERDAIAQLAKEKTEGFPWLAQAYSDYLYYQDFMKAEDLALKPHPAPKAAEELREVARKRRVAEKLYRVLRYQVQYYESLFPWLVDFKGEEVDDLVIQLMGKTELSEEERAEPEDAARKWLTQAEYDTLPTVEKYQKALDRYWHRRKSKWEIGRDYERYAGYLYENRGYGVYYQGIVEGLDDLGRDLICVKDNTTEVVQCKYWSKDKQIHEKHIFQLYGTMVALRIDHPDREVSGCFMTATNLSPRARRFAEVLHIEVVEDFPLKRYPCIKCNVSRRDGTKIYHLPFDQQYDRTLVEEERSERYVETVAEAEVLGFRRAFRWRGPQESRAEES